MSVITGQQPNLREPAGWRRTKNRIATVLMVVAFVLVVIPLVFVLITVVARGIKIPNAQPDPAGLASVNPIFTWVRLAQHVPVRIHIDQVPDGIRLVAGMTATVQVDPHARTSPP